MKKQKAYKFRLYPNLEQRILFEKTFGCSRFIWNQMLADKIAHYEKTGETLKNTPAQYKDEFPWLKKSRQSGSSQCPTELKQGL